MSDGTQSRYEVSKRGLFTNFRLKVDRTEKYIGFNRLNPKKENYSVEWEVTGFTHFIAIVVVVLVSVLVIYKTIGQGSQRNSVDSASEETEVNVKVRHRGSYQTPIVLEQSDSSTSANQSPATDSVQPP